MLLVLCGAATSRYWIISGDISKKVALLTNKGEAVMHFCDKLKENKFKSKEAMLV
jgi:hypothetical protein